MAEEKKSLKAIIRETIDEVIGREEDVISIDPNMNLGLESPLEINEE